MTTQITFRRAYNPYKKDKILGNSVINTHWYKSIDLLPSTAKYVGRPGPHGNSFSAKSGKYSREVSVALHRFDLYHRLQLDRTLLDRIKNDLSGYDLACWCKSPHNEVACHADTYLHILDSKCAHRDYTGSVISYLMEDLRWIVQDLKAWCLAVEADNGYSHYMVVYEMVAEIQFLFTVIKTWKDVSADDVCTIIATVVIECELARAEVDIARKLWRMEHCIWQIHSTIYKRDLSAHEPSPPMVVKIKKPKKG